MSRSKKLPITTDKRPGMLLTYNKVFRKRTRQYIRSHFNDNKDITYLSFLPTLKEAKKKWDFHIYKSRKLSDSCGISRKWHRECYFWECSPIQERIDICNECRKKFSRK